MKNYHKIAVNRQANFNKIVMESHGYFKSYAAILTTSSQRVLLST